MSHAPACFLGLMEICFLRLPCSSVEGLVFTLEIVCQCRLNLLVHNVVSPLGDRALFAQQQEISLLALKTFLAHPPPQHPPFHKLCFVMQCDLCPEAWLHQTAFNVVRSPPIPFLPHATLILRRPLSRRSVDVSRMRLI